jgi:hypothetical protein
MENWQTYAAPFIVFVALCFLVRRWWRSQKDEACSKGCSCPVTRVSQKKHAHQDMDL